MSRGLLRRFAFTGGILFVVAAVLLLSSCNYELPPLLKGASSAGGWEGGCPRPPEYADLPLALSPELNARLTNQFPKGSPETGLVAELRRNGFTMSAPCAEDSTIHKATFTEPQHWYGVFFPTSASVYWRIDPGKNLVWTMGFVDHTGP